MTCRGPGGDLTSRGVTGIAGVDGHDAHELCSTETSVGTDALGDGGWWTSLCVFVNTPAISAPMYSVGRNSFVA